MILSETDQLHLNAAAGHLQLGDALDAWHDTIWLHSWIQSFHSLGT
jgi:hypothetical protein